MANVDVDWAGAADAQEKVFQPGIELFVLKAILNHWLLNAHCANVSFSIICRL